MGSHRGSGVMAGGDLGSRRGAEARSSLRIAEGFSFYSPRCGKRLRSKRGFAQSIDSPRLRASARTHFFFPEHRRIV